ncbi:MAG TPA: sulfate ABC transporter permease subunit CysW [Verrucomicrobiae bacterium]|jgi:sulfate transport system permease protein|nr:sulfate ABC transporter permease subunit CysW [Verrucomicrobiae bacterium]
MAGHVKKKSNGDSHRQSRRGTEESPVVKWVLITIALAFCMVFLLLPLVNVFAQAFGQGWKAYLRALVDPDSWAAIRLTLIVAAISVPLNVIFGVCAAWAIAKFNFRFKSMLITLIDLPFSVSPVVAGLMFVVLFGMNGFLGPWLQDHPLHLFGKEIEIKIIFAVPGIVLATMFVTFPFVARELIPIMQATGTEQEQAALTLGASGWATFWHVTLPSVKWGLIYGIILCNARAMGEFGAVSVVSGHIIGRTETMPLRVQSLYEGGSAASGAAAFAVASLLALLALVTLGLKTLLEWKQTREFERSQQAVQPVRHNETAFLKREDFR